MSGKRFFDDLERGYDRLLFIPTTYFSLRIKIQRKGHCYMKNIFSYDSKLVQVGNKMGELIILNLLTMCCSFPLLTIGASVTAMHYTIVKITQENGQSVFKEFFKSFRANLRQSTALWLLYLFLGGILGVDYYILTRAQVKMNLVLFIIMLLGAIVLLISLSWSFILQSRYVNTVAKTLKNSIIVGISQMKYTIPISALLVLPLALMYLIPELTAVIYLIGFSLSGYLQAKLYYKVFSRFEKQ